MQFSRDGVILGAFTSVYLLEKPRIVAHMEGERNYHGDEQPRWIAEMSATSPSRPHLGRISAHISRSLLYAVQIAVGGSVRGEDRQVAGLQDLQPEGDRRAGARM